MFTKIGTGWVVNVFLDPPNLQDNTAYVDRLVEKLKNILKADNIYINLPLVRKIPNWIRTWKYQIKCIMFKKSSNSWTLVHLVNATNHRLIAGLALDLGTSRITIRLINLVDGSRIGEKVFDNPQIIIGSDVLARIHYSNNNGLKYLNSLLINAINKQINDLCSKSKILPSDVYVASVAGNTTMTHLFLKINPEQISKEPYTPSVNMLEIMDSKEIGLKINSNAQTFIFPNVGSYLGGDIVAGILYSGIYENNKLSMLVDIGTNAEIVVGNKDWIIACAGAAGPAFEGDLTKFGAMAGPGIIDSININLDSNKIETTTIGDAPPSGICGSGFIDLAAQLFLSKMIDFRGKFNPNIIPKVFFNKNGLTHIIIVPKEKSATGKTISISQADIDSLLKSKAAMYAILETIADVIGINLNANELESFLIAGTFGLYINPKSAISIGMLPDLPLKCYKSIGNSSLKGASMILECVNNLSKIDNIRKKITYIELNINQNFMNKLSAAQFLPHTDISLFPTHRDKLYI